jgi:AraC-like DNA-binding protein
MDPAKQSDGARKPALPAERERRRWPRQASPHEHFEAQLHPALEPISFSTHHLAPEEQFSAWQALVEPLVAVIPPGGASPDDGFPADHTAWNLGGMLLVQQSVPAHSYVRSADRLRSSSIDHWYLALPGSGRTWTEVDGRVAEGRPGSVEFRSLGHPFRGRATESTSVCLYLPREKFGRFATILDAKNNSILTGNFATLLNDFVAGVVERLRSLTAEDLPRIVQATSDLITAGLSPSSAGGDVATAQLSNLAVMERARRYVQNNLDAADLTPENMSRALGISRTRLFQMFEPNGGVLHYIQKRRLLAAHEALGDPKDERRIVDISEAYGFSSAANFSRAFSREFGYSPREARNALASYRLADTGSRTGRDQTSTFEGWLRTLGT